MKEEDQAKLPGLEDYDWSKPSKAVIAMSGDGGFGCVLWTVGAHVNSMIREAGVNDLDLLGLDDAPEGISIWEGDTKTVHTHTPDCNEWDSWLEGSFRAPFSKGADRTCTALRYWGREL